MTVQDSTGWQRVIVIAAPAVLIAAAVTYTAPAHADNDSYLQWLTDHGVVGEGPGLYSPQFALQTGANTCAAIQAGRTDLFLMSQLIEAYDMGKLQAGDFVSAAHQYLCPGT